MGLARMRINIRFVRDLVFNWHRCAIRSLTYAGNRVLRLPTSMNVIPVIVNNKLFYILRNATSFTDLLNTEIISQREKYSV